MSALQLTQRELVNWPGYYDSFFNAALLGRPRRRFSEGAYGGMRIDWFELSERRFDAHLITGLRLFARDAGARLIRRKVETPTPTSTRFGTSQTSLRTQIDRPGGLAAWNEFGPVSSASRSLLIEAAGVQMPGAGFILGVWPCTWWCSCR